MGRTSILAAACAAAVTASSLASSSSCTTDTLAAAPPPADNNDTAVVTEHVLQHMNETWNNASGTLPYPFLSPAGPYRGELWDWDSWLLGVSTAPYSLDYFVGSMSNFLALTNLTDGDVKGCLTPNGATETLYHAKPIIIQGAFQAAKLSGGNYSLFRPFKAQMEALLTYWETSEGRVDPVTGLHRWHDQLESGADNLVYSECPSAYSPCWDEARDAFTLSSPDLEIFLAREHTAYARFAQRWAAADAAAEAAALTAEAASEASAAAARRKSSAPASPSSSSPLLREADEHLAIASRIASRVDQYMWIWIDDARTKGYYGAYNTSSRTAITNRAYQMAWPLWGGFANETLTRAAVAQLLESDMWTPFGIRSVSSDDPRYSNANIITPYSNWDGPVWIQVNAILAFALRAAGYVAESVALSDNLVHTLAEDLRMTATWHECYSSETGAGLAAPGFLSWNTLGMTVQKYVAEGVDPFVLS